MNRRMLARLGVGALLVAACSSNPEPVPLAGSAGDLAALEGEWRGDYEFTRGPARFGSILFRLSAGEDHAHGDVLMIARTDRDVPPIPTGEDPWASRTQSGRTSQLLSITFVQARGGAIAGALAPYTDPTCGCTLHTTFTGRVSGDVIDGTFTSEHVETGTMTGGTWRVSRHRP